MANQTYEERRAIKIILSQAKYMEQTMREIVQSAGNKIGWNYISFGTFMHNFESLVNEAKKYVDYLPIYRSYALDEIPDAHNVNGVDQKILFEAVLYSVRSLIAVLENYSDFADDEIDNLENLISQRFRAMFHDIPDSEKEVQNTLENLFIANNKSKGTDYDRETGKFKFSGREYIPDFIIPPLNLCLEVKLLKNTQKRSKIIEEINADITAYSSKYERLIFLVYDLGGIRDETEFKRDIEAKKEDIKVIIIKH